MTRDERFEACFLKYKNLVMRFVIDATGDYQAAQRSVSRYSCGITNT